MLLGFLYLILLFHLWFLRGALPTFFSFSPLMTVMIVLSLYPLGQFVGSPFIGAYSDKVGSRTMVMISMGLTAIGYLLSAVALYQRDIFFFCTTRFFTGFVEGNFGILRAEVARLSQSSNERLRFFGLLSSAASLGWLCGPLLGSFFSHSNISLYFTYQTPFIFGGFMGLFGVLLAFISLENKVEKARGKDSVLNSFVLVWKIPGLSQMLFFSFIMTLALDSFYEFYPTFLVGGLQGGSQEIANNTTILALSIIFSQIFIVPKLCVKKRISFLVPSVLVAVSMFGLAHGVNALSFGLCGLGIGVLMTLVTAFVSEKTPKDLQGTVMGSMASLRNLGDFIACLGLGLLGGVNLYLPLAFIALVILFAAEAFVRISQKLEPA